MTTKQHIPAYPTRIGAVVDAHTDPCFPAYLADCLMLYDEIVLVADPPTVLALYLNTEPDIVARLVHTGRLRFCPPSSPISHYGQDRDNSERDDHEGGLTPWRQRLLDVINVGIRRNDAIGTADALEILEAGLLPAAEKAPIDEAAWIAIRENLLGAFRSAAQRPEYSWLVPPNTHYTTEFYFEIGLRAGIGRLADLLSHGVCELDFDLEVARLLDICCPTRSLDDMTSTTARTVDTNFARDLHRIENLPPIGDLIRARDWTADHAFDVVLSDEAEQLRVWLRENMGPGVDVRDAYHSNLKELPSRKSWTTWVRFGTVTGVSTLIGALLSGNPIAGAAAGVAAGAADQQFGARAVESLVDDYHPREWLSFVKDRLSVGSGTVRN
jgi:hypothetical protein